MPAGTHPYVGSQRHTDRVFESSCCCEVVGVRGHPLRTGPGTRDLRFEATDGPAAIGGEACKLSSSVVVRFGEERLAVALCELSAVDELDGLIGEFEKPHGMGEVAPASPEPTCEVRARDVDVVEE